MNGRPREQSALGIRPNAFSHSNGLRQRPQGLPQPSATALPSVPEGPGPVSRTQRSPRGDPVGHSAKTSLWEGMDIRMKMCFAEFHLWWPPGL